jgi:hypothetical protein
MESMSLMFIGYKIINVFRINRKIDVMITAIERVSPNKEFNNIGHDARLGFRIPSRDSHDRNDYYSYEHLGPIHDRV